MEILKVQDNLQYIQKILEDKLQELDTPELYYDCQGYYYETLLEKLKDNNNSVLISKDDITQINEYNIYGLNILYVNVKSEDLDFLIEKYPESIIVSDAYCENKNYQIANMKEDKNLYTNTYNANIFIPNNMDKNILINRIKEDIYPELDYLNIKFEVKTGQELGQEIAERYKNNPVFNGYTKNDNNLYNVAGFHYLNIDTIDYNKNFLLCKQNNNYLGVIKFGEYGFDDKHIGLPYIDVNKHYRNKGIATMMVKELNKHLTNELPLFLTRESEMGEKYHMKDLFVKNINNTICVPYEMQELYYEYKEKNKLNEFPTITQKTNDYIR